MGNNLNEFLNDILDTPLSEKEVNFELAFIRKSDSSNNGNQNLAFLGDVVLSLIIREFIFKKYPDFDKGFLTQKSNKFEIDDYLAEIGRELEIFKFLDFKNNPPRNPEKNDTVIAEAVEALFGAIYLHRGFEQAEKIGRVLNYVTYALKH